MAQRSNYKTNNLHNAEDQLFPRNLCLILWAGGVQREKWVEKVASWLNGDLHKAQMILRGAVYPDATVLTQAARFGRAEQEDLLYRDLVSERNVDLLRENLRTLLGGAGAGRKKFLAERLSVHASTVSRWLSGAQRPSHPMQQQIAVILGLRANVDLETTPLFLSLLPMTDAERRAWLRRHIDVIDSETLEEVFPALARILSNYR